MPAHNYLEEPKKPSFTIEFDTLSGCDDACRILTHNGIRYRTGKTLVPFRLTGNIEWGVPAPVMDGVEGLTVWVWPESLWAPISFTQTYLEQEGRSRDEWKDYWCSKESGVYQFIGQDNIYFYGDRRACYVDGSAGIRGQDCLCLPRANCSSRQLWLTTTFFSSTRRLQARGAVKPPMADDLLEHYTPEQLRMHWLGLGLGQRSVSFMPKPYNPDAKPGRRRSRCKGRSAPLKRLQQNDTHSFLHHAKRV